MNQQIKAEYWLKCWIAVAGSSNSTQAGLCSVWADKMLKDFDSRFKDVTPKTVNSLGKSQYSGEVNETAEV